MTKCLIVQPVHADALTLLRDNGIEPVICPNPSEATILSLITECQAVITRDAGLSGRAMRAAPGLRVVVAHGAGHDAIDKLTATECGILVCNTPGANARSVMELALGLSLAVARRIPAADRDERAARPGFRERWATTELSGKTALIVGWGAIGAGFGQMLRDALGMEVLVFSPRATVPAAFERVGGLDAALSRSDLISLHTPLRPETRALMGQARFAACKPGAILINTARAGLVDEAALAEALAQGRIGGAGLDVYSHDAPQGPLAAFDQVILTPHLGGSTTEALIRVGLGSVGHVLTALSGQRPVTAQNDPPGWG